MDEFKAAVREFIAGKFLELAMAVDAAFVFDVIGSTLASERKKPATPIKE